MEQTSERTKKVSYRAKLQALEQKVHDERAEMLAQDGARPTVVDLKLMKKYGIYSRSTIWTYCRRVQSRNASKNPVINT